MSNSTKPVRLNRGPNFLVTNPVGNSDDFTVTTKSFDDKLVIGEYVVEGYKWLMVLPVLQSGAELDLVATFPEPKVDPKTGEVDEATKDRITWKRDESNPTADNKAYHVVPNTHGLKFTHPTSGKVIKPEFITRPMLSGQHLGPWAALTGMWGSKTLPTWNDYTVRTRLTK